MRSGGAKLWELGDVLGVTRERAAGRKARGAEIREFVSERIAGAIFLEGTRRREKSRMPIQRGVAEKHGKTVVSSKLQKLQFAKCALFPAQGKPNNR